MVNSAMNAVSSHYKTENSVEACEIWLRLICYSHKNKHVVLLILLIKNVVQFTLEHVVC